MKPPSAQLAHGLQLEPFDEALRAKGARAAERADVGTMEGATRRGRALARVLGAHALRAASLAALSLSPRPAAEASLP